MALGTYDNPLWKEVSTFWEALGYMIAKGVDEIYASILVAKDNILLIVAQGLFGGHI